MWARLPRVMRLSTLRRPSAVVLALLVTSSLAGSARAEAPPAGSTTTAPASTNERALALFKESQTAYRDARFKEALRLLQEAYALRPEPVLLYNMARVREATGDLDDAIALYQRYLSQASDVPDRPALEARLKSLKALQEAGRRREPARPARRQPSVVPWIVAGAGGAVLAGATVLGVIAKGHESEAMDDPVQRTAVASREDATTYATLANVGFAVGGAIALTGIVWGVLTVGSSGPAKTASPTTSVVATPTGMVLRF